MIESGGKMNTLTYFLVKQTFWEQLQEELEDVINMFKDFFLMIKEVTYDVLVNAIGGDIVNLLLIALGVIGVMIICLSVINR